MYRMVLYPVHPLIFKIVFKKLGRVHEVLLRAKKCHDPLSEHDLKDLKDVQDGVVSCPSFNL